MTTMPTRFWQQVSEDDPGVALAEAAGGKDELLVLKESTWPRTIRAMVSHSIARGRG
jgi:hypothetical protein